MDLLVDVFYSGSTHLKASANKNGYDIHQVAQKPVHYLDALNSAIDADRLAYGKKPFSHQDDEEPPMKEVKISPVDPDADYLVRNGKPTGLFYLDHRTVDGVHSLITDTQVTPANVHDSEHYLDRIDRMRTRFGFEIGAVGLDAGYFTPHICKGLVERNIYGVIGYRRPNHKDGFFYKREYEYDAQADVYRCPNGLLLAYSATNRLSVSGKEIYKHRKETVERSFADTKQLHGHRYALSWISQGQGTSTAGCSMSKHQEDGEFIRKGPAPFFIVLFNSIKVPMATMEGILCSFEK